MKKSLCFICPALLVLSSFLLFTSCSKNSPTSSGGVTGTVKIAYVKYVTSDDRRLMIVNADGTGDTRVSYTAEPEGVGAMAGSGLIPYSNQVYSTSDNDISLIYNDGTGNTRLTYSGYAYSPDLSKDALKLVYLRSGNIYSLNTNLSGGEQLIASGSSFRSPKWSPDGTKILYTGSNIVGVMDADGNNAGIICDDGTDTITVYCAAWSPDGVKIAFAGRDTTVNSFGIWKMNSDGSGLELLQYFGSVYGGNIAWLSNGRIVFDKENVSTADLYIMDADGTNTTNLTNSLSTYDVLDLYNWY